MKEKIKNFDIPVVILCGGKGTRIAPRVSGVPKPLLEIEGKPILWHVMKIYASQGFERFILCLGHKADQVKKYFENNNKENWQIEYIDTGIDASKSKRIANVELLINRENFFLAYGDDVADIDLAALFKAHLKNNSIVTITAVRMVSDFGIVEIGKNSAVIRFKEKPRLNKWMNGGFMVANRRIFNFLKLGELESEVFERLVKLKQLSAYKHFGQWKTMNTLKDNLELNTLWKNGKAFWKIW